MIVRIFNQTVEMLFVILGRAKLLVTRIAHLETMEGKTTMEMSVLQTQTVAQQEYARAWELAEPFNAKVTASVVAAIDAPTTIATTVVISQTSSQMKEYVPAPKETVHF